MSLYKTARNILDVPERTELVLDLVSFSGGEVTIGVDGELKNNEVRTMQNWEVLFNGGITRSNGFTNVITGSPTYTSTIDFVGQYYDFTNSTSMYISGGNLLKKNSSAFALDHASDAASFTSGVLTHGVSAGGYLWLTNTTDNLKKKLLGSAVAAPAGVPPSARARIYEHPTFRLIAEGGGKTIYGSRTGYGNWTSADAWSASNDAWSIDMPDDTQGAVCGFPSGNDLTVFTKFDTFVVYNMPNVNRRKVLNGIGCNAPYSVCRGNEGVYFFSNYPTRGIFLWDGSEFTNLTLRHNFVDEISLSNRIFGCYRGNKYYFVYNKVNSGVSYPNKLRIYDAKFNKWTERTINSSVSDTFGYMALLTRDNNELYSGSSQKGNVYEIDDSSTSDNGNSTQATITTKNYSSKDFSVLGGGQFSIDNVRLKLIKVTAEHKGTNGAFSVLWSSDYGKYTGSQTFDLNATGDLINSTFIVNTSYIITTPNAKTTAKSFNNSAIGRKFSFQINNSASGNIPEIYKIKIHAVTMEEY